MLKLSQILLPVDFSGQGAGAAKYAAALARHFHATLTLLHVNEVYAAVLRAPQEFHGPIDTGWITELEAERLRELNSYQEAELDDLHVQRIVVSGDPSQQITDYAHKEKTDLIVMPTHGYGPFRRFLLGSVTAKVLHDAACPVWTGVHMQETSQKEWKVIRNVLCAIDGEPGSERVLTWARNFAGEFHALVTIVQTKPADGGGESTTTRANQVREEIQRLKKRLGVRGGIDLEEGEPAAVAAWTNADALVIGRGPCTSGSRGLPSSAYSIVRESPCPVVSI
jgi:nucleotide-binding universal stress UspA family protein